MGLSSDYDDALHYAREKERQAREARIQVSVFEGAVAVAVHNGVPPEKIRAIVESALETS